MRSNYASVDCAASIVYSNNAQNPADLLKPDRDSYLLYECSAAGKSVHVQLCQDILVDSFSIGNFELFSSSFKDIKLYGTDRYAYEATNWISLGSFVATDQRIEQLFTIDNPHHWVSHIRLDFLSHWGDEFYCPLNTIAVHGTTMLDQSKIILTPEEEQAECAPSLEIDPCVVVRSPLEKAQDCSRPKLEHNGGSVYEVILTRLQHLEMKNEKTNAFMKQINSTYIRETHQLQGTLQSTLDQVQSQRQIIAVQMLLLVVFVGYVSIQALARLKLHDDEVYLGSSSGMFGSHEKLPRRYSIISQGILSPAESDEDTTLTLETLHQFDAANAAAHSRSQSK